MYLKKLMGLAAICLLATTAIAQTQTGPIRIGVLTDLTGPYSDQTGAGSVIAARMALEDFGPTVLGRPIEIVVGDHQNKPDIGSAIAHRWFDQEGVSMVADVPTSSVALAVQDIARKAGRIVMFSGAASTELTGKSCAPLSFQWTYDTYAMAAGTGAAVTRNGGDTWFLMTLDFAFGAAMESDLRAMVAAQGGKVLGGVKHPFGTPDFSSFLLQAKASGAKVIGLLNAGQDTANAIKQASEFGITSDGQKLAAMVATVVDVQSLGLPVAQGLQFTESFYWDMDEATRTWSRRFFAKKGKMPTMAQAGVYSATMHWLKAVKDSNTLDSAVVATSMRRTPVNDMMTKGASIRSDGRLMRDFYLFEVKKPADSKGPWDLYRLVRTIPAAEAARPLAQSSCPLVKANAGN
jgi:branched-chain amino acid transport system substrate-binding protein